MGQIRTVFDLFLDFKMEKERLEFYLNRDNSFGFNTKNDNDTIAWVILSKRFPMVRFFERFTEEDDPYVFKEQTRIRDNPYNVWIAELKKDIYDGDRFPVSEDYLLNESYSFPSLDEAENFLLSLGLRLSEIKWSSEI